MADESLRQAAAVNSMEDFRYVFEKAFEGLVIDRMEGNEGIFTRLMGDPEFRQIASDHILQQVYETIKEDSPALEEIKGSLDEIQRD